MWDEITSFYRGLRRVFRYWWQRRTRGWDDSDIWSLDYTLAKWLCPRLKLMRDQKFGHPCDLTQEEWNSHLDKMLAAFAWYASEERWSDYKGFAEHQEGLDLFAKYYGNLWT